MSDTGTPPAPPAAWWRSTALAVIRHPSLWPTAMRAVATLAAPGWWRRRPFLPLPDERYLRFRLETQYGSAAPEPEDVLTYLRWLRRSASGR